MSIAFEMSQNNANDESFANTLNIQILQYNCARSMQIMHACMKFAKDKTDIVILQESWMRDENNNFTFIIYLHQIKCSEYSCQSIDICCEKRKEIYMHIKIKHSLFFFFIKCMQSMTMTLSRRCIFAKLHVI